MEQRGVIRSAVLRLTVVPLYAAHVVPWLLLALAIRYLIEQHWLTGALLAACAPLAYVGLLIAGLRLFGWAEARRRPLPPFPRTADDEPK